MKNEPKVKSLYRALKLLECFDEKNTELGASELSRMSGNLKSTTHNIMETFVMCGFAERNPDNGKYRLGHKIMELSSTMYLSNDFRQLLRPYIGRIANHCNETVYLAVPQQASVLYLDAAYPNGSIHVSSVIGKRVPMYCTAVGKAMLADMPEEVFDLVIKEGMPSLTPTTLTTEEDLRNDLNETRKRGYAIDNMEHEYGIRCMGIDVKNIRGKVVGGISLSGPSLRLTNEKFEMLAPFMRQIREEIRKIIK